MVTVHGVRNLQEGLRAKIIAFDPAAGLYVVKGPDGQVWGLNSEKLRPMQIFDLSSLGDDWCEIPEDVTLPGGVEVKMDLATGRRLARYSRQEEPALSGAVVPS
jgi:hypothetical protein